MRYSQLHTKTNKSAKAFDSVNATLLTKAGFIDQTMAGVYSYLPLGTRVLQKIEQIVREEMDQIAAEVLLPSLSPQKLWRQTGRLDSVDVLFSAQGANPLSQQKNDSEYVLNSTHEEIITPISMQVNRSYRDLPAYYYQIQTKFRNEARPKSGILRGREFRMKDLYSFHPSEEDLKRYYEVVKEVYLKIFSRLGLGDDTLVVLASGGDFTKDYSHEFQTRCDAGEDIIFYAQSASIAYNREVAPSRVPAVTGSNSEPNELQKIATPGIVTVDQLVEFLGAPIEKTSKTLLYQAPSGELVAVALRGDYEVNEEKLSRYLDQSGLMLADEVAIETATGAKRGFTGLINLPAQIKLVVDDSLEPLTNFETGANETDYHYINVNWDRDLPRPETFADIKTAKPGDIYPETDEVYETFTGSEVGNIFPLNVKFSNAFSYHYIDEKGQEQPVYMGSYGIGTTRLMGVIVEKFHDDRGIIWPQSVAPYQVYLISLKGAEARGEVIYQELLKAGIEVLWDDRDESPGAKFSDADLIGLPVRLVVSPRTGEQIEWKRRDSQETELLDLAEVTTRLKP